MPLYTLTWHSKQNNTPIDFLPPPPITNGLEDVVIVLMSIFITLESSESTFTQILSFKPLSPQTHVSK